MKHQTKKYLILGGAAALALYFLTRKKSATGATVLFEGDVTTGWGKVLRLPSDVIAAAEMRQQQQAQILKQDAKTALDTAYQQLHPDYNPLA